MNYLELKYLDSNTLKGFEKYKYNSIDTSPLSNYVMHPFWNQLVKLFPRWIAPNILTVTGFLFTVVNAILLTYYDYDFSASSDTIKSTDPVPNWVWLVCAFNHFLSHNLDGIDGKQARRTGTNGPLGELMDHGLDSWACFFLPYSIYSIFGRGELSYPPIRVFFIFWTIFITFYFSHWEKYNTGILYLPWSYDITHLSLFLMYLISYFKTYQVWKISLPFLDLSTGQIFEYISHFGSFALSVPLTFLNVYLAYKSKSLKKKFFEGLRPLVSFFCLFFFTTFWAFYSPTDVLSQDPRFFFCMIGTIFSQIACRLIINQMSSTRCNLFNWFLYPLFFFNILILLKVQFFIQHELCILRAITVFYVIAHIHYGVCIVRQLCDHFNINCFSIEKRKILIQNHHKRNK